MLNGLVVDKGGTKRWYKDGQLHREDGPAVEQLDGTKIWYYKDIYINFGDLPNPALWERLTSTEANGGPLLNGCVVDGYRNKRWYKDDQLHRVDGPAIECADGRTTWYIIGERLGWNAEGFWILWDLLTDTQRGNPTLLKYLPR